MNWPALAGVEDLWPATTFQLHLHDIKTVLRVKAVRELPAVAVGFSKEVHVPGEQIHDRHQLEKAFLQRDVGDVGGPDLIHRRDLAEIHQAGKAFGRIAWNRGAGFLVDRP